MSICVLLIFSGVSNGAQRIDISKRFSEGLQDYSQWREKRNPGNLGQQPKVEDILGLTGGESLKDGASIKTDPSISEDEALIIATNHMGDDPDAVETHSIHITLEIYVEDQEATVNVISFLAYSLSYTIWRNGKPSRPSFIINANTGDVIRQWEALTSHKSTKRQARFKHLRARSSPQQEGTKYEFHAIGGNVKMGKNMYGENLPALYVTQVGETCYLENEKIKVINAQESTSETFSFPCEQGFNDSINQAYSPMADAFFYGTMTYDLFKEWLGVEPLSFKIEMVIHEGDDYENAYWDGSKTYFGDGYSTFYPLIILDVAAHEVGHGFTEQNSGLIYSEQSGGMNEAFSDMAGIAAEEYMKSAAEWMLGEDAFKAEEEALRYMIDPSKDGESANDLGQFCPGMDVHHSSGIYNRAFYLLSNSPGWTVRMAFQTFATANQLYWTPDSSFSKGACGVVQAAEDLGFNTDDIVHVFSEVGVSACGSSTGGSVFEQLVDMHALGNESLRFSFVLEEDLRYIRIETYGDFHGQTPWILHVETPRRMLSTSQSSDSLNIYAPATGQYTITLEAMETFSAADLYIIKDRIIISEFGEEINQEATLNGTFQLPEEVIEAGHPVAIRTGFPDIEDGEYPLSFLVNYGQPIENGRGQIRPCGRSNLKKNVMEAFIRHPQPGTYYYQIGESSSYNYYSATDMPEGFKLYLEVLIIPQSN